MWLATAVPLFVTKPTDRLEARAGSTYSARERHSKMVKSRKAAPCSSRHKQQKALSRADR